MNFSKKTVWTAAILGAWYLWAKEYVPEVAEATSTIVGWVQWVLEYASEGINTATETVIGTAAPFAFPMIAGGYLGKKVADSMKIEWDTMRRVASVAGIWAWASLWYAAAGSFLAPALTVAWAWYAGYKSFQGVRYITRKTIGGVKWAINWVRTA